jgi:hypothetical protein
MSRTRHKLQSEDWYGEFATYFHKENREMRQRGREKRRRVEQHAEQQSSEDQLYYMSMWDDDY